MQRFLSIYLIVTGIGAAVALTMPSLVVIGLFLILPGLILSLMPTAFLWGCVFTAAWMGARYFLGGTFVAAIVASVLTAIALAAATQPSRLIGWSMYRMSLLPDVTPAERIAMKGDVRLDLPRPRWDNINSKGQVGQRGFSCDNLCLALLFTPGVTSVTINSSPSSEDHRTRVGGFDTEARTYRLIPRSDCTDGGLQPDLEGRSGLFPGKLEEGTALNAEWNIRLANDVCLTRSSPIGRYDLLVRHVSNGGPTRFVGSWSLLPAMPTIEYVEILDGAGDTLLRRFKTSVRILSRFLHIGAEGGIENFRFGWGRTTLSNKPKYGEIDLLRELEAHTNTVGRISGEDLLPAMRTQLRSALADPSIPGDAPAFRVLPAFFNALPNPLSSGDLAIVAGLASDDRITRYENIWKLKVLPLDQQDVIRAAFVERALATDDQVKLYRSLANTFLAGMPSGSFSRLTPGEERLLASPAKRWALPSLVARLHETGPGRVPLLLTIIRDHSLARRKNIEEVRAGRAKAYETSLQSDGHMATVRAARSALCRLGPNASDALQPLEQMLASGVIDENELSGHNGADWHLTLARLGKPVDELRKPPRLSGTDEMHRQRIRKKLERFRPDRDC